MSLDEKIEKAIEPLTEMYEKIQNDLLVIIAKHFKINNEFLNSDYWRMKKLEEMGLFNQEVIDYIARYSGKTKTEILKALNKVGMDTINISKLRGLFEDEVLKINPNILVNNYTINKMIETSYSELENTFINLSSKVIQASRKEYLNVVESVYLKTSMGTHSYQEAIRESLNDLGNRGITTLTYTTIDDEGNIVGIRTYDIEGTVRREVLNGARHLSTDISMQVAEELDCEYVYISEHLECRPTHFDWQGTIVKRESLTKAPINYGDIEGLCGINCRHYFEPYFGDARNNELKRYNQEECSKAYALSQRQRYLERGVRKWQRKAEMFKANDDMVAYSKCKEKTKEWQLRTKAFTEDNNLKRDFAREYVSKRENKNDTLSLNATVVRNKEVKKLFIENIKEKDFFNKIEKYELEIVDSDVENAIIIEENGNVYKFIGTSDYVNINANYDNAILTHNHPTFDGEIGGSFGKDDFNTLFNHQNIRELRAIDEKYVYKARVLKPITISDYDMAYRSAMLIDDDYKHCVMEELRKKGLIYYERAIRKGIK